MRGDRTRRPRLAYLLAIAAIIGAMPGASPARTTELDTKTDTTPAAPIEAPAPKLATPTEIDVREMTAGELGADQPIGLTYIESLEALVLATPTERGTRLVGVRTWGDPVGRRFVRGIQSRSLAAHAGGLVAFDETTTTSIPTTGLFRGSAATTRDASALNIAGARGATAGPDGAFYVLDGASKQIVAVPVAGAPRVSDRTRIGKAVSAPRGIAYNPGDGRMYVGDGAVVRVLEGTGVQTAAFDMSDVRVKRVLGLAFAPSADTTDDPANVSLFVLADTTSFEHEVLELRLPFQGDTTPTDKLRATRGRGLGRLPGSGLDKQGTASQAPAISATLVRDIDMTSLTDELGGSAPASSDPSDLVYDPIGDRLIVTDGEIEEPNMCWLYKGVNMFHISLQGEYLTGGTSAPNEAAGAEPCPAGHTNTVNSKNFSKEPVGAGWFDPANEMMVTDDDQDDLSWLKPGSDNIYGTSDDTVKEFTELRSFMGAAADPESASYDPNNNVIWVVDGVNEELYRWAPGPDGKFSGQVSTSALLGDDIVTQSDLTPLGVIDPEGAAYDKFTDTLLILSHKQDFIARLDNLGQLVETIDVSVAALETPAGLALGPSSIDPGAVSLWITDRGIDNGSQGTEPNQHKCEPVRQADCPNDGRVIELSTGGISNFAPVVTVTTPTPGSNVDATPGTFQVRASATDQEDCAAGSPAATCEAVTSSIDILSPAMVGTETCSMDNTVTPAQKVCTVKLNPGLHTITVKAFDQHLVFGQKSMQLYVGEGPFNVTLALPAGADDAEELVSNGSVNLTDGDLELGADGSNQQVVGVRFPISVPQGGYIRSATIRFETYKVLSNTPLSVKIDAHAADNAPAFQSVARNLSSRPRTSASLNWNVPHWTADNESGPNQTTPDLAPIMNEIMARPGWQAGNSMAFLFSRNGTTGSRRAKSYERPGAPVMTIGFQFKPPISILSPSTNASVPMARPSRFVADAGPLTDQITWSSSIDGVLPQTGGDVRLSLSAHPDGTGAPLEHEISASVKDAQNRVGVAKIKVIVENQVPVVRIDAPANNSSHASTAQIQFVGSAHDPDDGNIAYQLRWTSSLDGPLGRGSMIRRQLRAGPHIIKLEATDRFGKTGTATINLQVGAGAAPSLQIASSESTSYAAGSKVTFGASAVDREDGDLTQQIKWSSQLAGSATTQSLGTGGTTSAVFNEGVYNITAKVTDTSQKSTTKSIQVTITPGLTVADIPIASAADDAEQFVSGAMRLSSGELNMTNDQGRRQVVGLRFALPVPKGATITEAYVQFTSGATNDEAGEFVIQCQDSPNASKFTAATNDLTRRMPIGPAAVSVSWQPAPWTAGDRGVDQRTPDLKDLVQRIVNKSSWEGGNAIVFLISGLGNRTADSFERGLGPILHVDWA